MLSQEVLTFISTLLEKNKCQLMATKIYLQHQLELQPEFRVMEVSEQEAEDDIKAINQQLYWYEKSIVELDKLPGT
jgi:hypothetical protein